jgi:hypothetical protein
VDGLFPAAERPLALAELDRAIDPRDAVTETEAGAARIQLAILTLARGDLAKLRHQVDEALKDWRDVLCAAYSFDQTTSDPAIRWSLADLVPELGRDAIEEGPRRRK